MRSGRLEHHSQSAGGHWAFWDPQIRCDSLCIEYWLTRTWTSHFVALTWLTLYSPLLLRWSESIILSLIIASTIIFVIQAARPLPDAYQTLPVRGYFHQWEDYAQFCLFVLFTCVAWLVSSPLVFPLLTP